MASYIQLNFSATAWAGGVGTALFALGMVLGRLASGYFVKQDQLARLILWTALGGTVVTLAFPWLHSLKLFFPLLFLSGLATAPYWPSLQSYCSDRLPGTDTTMLFILLSCAGVPGCGVVAWLMGVIGNRGGGLASAFYLIPACYLLLALLVASERRTAISPALARR